MTTDAMLGRERTRESTLRARTSEAESAVARAQAEAELYRRRAEKVLRAAQALVEAPPGSKDIEPKKAPQSSLTTPTANAEVEAGRTPLTAQPKAGTQTLLPGATGMLDTSGKVGKLSKNQEDVSKGPLFQQEEEAEKKAAAAKQTGLEDVIEDDEAAPAKAESPSLYSTRPPMDEPSQTSAPEEMDEIEKLAARATSRDEFFAGLAEIQVQLTPADRKLSELFMPTERQEPTDQPLPPRMNAQPTTEK